MEIGTAILVGALGAIIGGLAVKVLSSDRVIEALQRKWEWILRHIFQKKSLAERIRARARELEVQNQASTPEGIPRPEQEETKLNTRKPAMRRLLAKLRRGSE